jgi:hypothetical protein
MVGVIDSDHTGSSSICFCGAKYGRSPPLPRVPSPPILENSVFAPSLSVGWRMGQQHRFFVESGKDASMQIQTGSGSVNGSLRWSDATYRARNLGVGVPSSWRSAGHSHRTLAQVQNRRRNTCTLSVAARLQGAVYGTGNTHPARVEQI